MTRTAHTRTLTLATAFILTLPALTSAQTAQPPALAPNPSFAATPAEHPTHPEEKKVVPPLVDPHGHALVEDQPWQQEQRLWSLIQSKDLATFQSLLLPDFAYVADAITSGPELLETLSTCTLASFTLTAPQTHMATPSVAILTYTATEDITCGTEHQTDTLNIAAVWVHRGDRWLAQLHTETPTKTK